MGQLGDLDEDAINDIFRINLKMCRRLYQVFHFSTVAHFYAKPQLISGLPALSIQEIERFNPHAVYRIFGAADWGNREMRTSNKPPISKTECSLVAPTARHCSANTEI
jgi:hypothetical protein